MKDDLITMAQRLRYARNKKALTQMQLAKLSGVKQSDISKLERGSSRTTAGIARLAAALDVPAAWLELAQGAAPSWGRSPPPSRGVAQVVSLDEITVVHILNWSDLMTGELPQVFKVAAPDKAMEPRVKKGKMLEFTVGLKPEPGDGVLVRDKTGNMYFREYRERRAGEWAAHAIDAAYGPLDAVEDGLTIVAVLTSVQGRWSE